MKLGHTEKLRIEGKEPNFHLTKDPERYYSDDIWSAGMIMLYMATETYQGTDTYDDTEKSIKMLQGRL